MISFPQGALLFTSAMLAGAVNSVAGGGTLLTFPALTHVLGNPIVANATSTVALWPGQLSSLYGYRKEIGESRKAVIRLAIPSLIGGSIGALLLLKTRPEVFAAIVPYLILLATTLFMVQGPLSQRLKKSRPETQEAPTEAESAENILKVIGVMVFQLAVGVYGGYFGAGIGIMMIAALGFMGFTNIHRMNGIKNINGLLINVVAICFFIFGHTKHGNGVGPQADRLIHWPLAALMMLGSIIGGYSGAGIARKVGQQNVRRIIIFIGFVLTITSLRK
jgi:uncharacterized protein